MMYGRRLSKVAKPPQSNSFRLAQISTRPSYSCSRTFKMIRHVFIRYAGLFQTQSILALYTVTTDNYVFKLEMCIEVKYIQHYLSKEWKCCVVHCLMIGTNLVLRAQSYISIVEVLVPNSQLLTTTMICDQPQLWYNISSVTKTLLLRTYPVRSTPSWISADPCISGSHYTFHVGYRRRRYRLKKNVVRCNSFDCLQQVTILSL